MGADRSERLAIIVTAQDLASGKLNKVRSELSQMGPVSRAAAVGLGTTMKVAQTGERAMGNLAGRIRGVTGAIGPLLGVGGLLGLGALLSGTIKEAADFGQNVANVTAITNLAVPVASAMVDTLDKWGVSTERMLPLLGKLEKNVGAITDKTGKGGVSAEKVTKATETLAVARARLNELEHKGTASASTLLAAHNRVAQAERALTAARKGSAMSLSGAAAFQKQYGVNLLDNNGKVADANELLLRSADYFNSNATATDKATFMSKLWGKAWQDLIPILSKGSAFIKAQEADAIHLTDTQLNNITKFRTASRDFQDAFGDIQVKIGAELMPLFTTGLTEASRWFDSNADKISGFFRDAATAAGNAAKSAGEIFNSLRQGWDTVPEPLRDFLVKGLLADRAIHFLFGFSPAKLVLSLAGDVIGPVLSHSLGGVLGGFAQRGSSPANPVFVSPIGGGLPGALPTAAAGGSILGDIAAGFAGLGLLGTAGLIIAPLSIAAIGLAITNASDPTGERARAGRAATAAARSGGAVSSGDVPLVGGPGGGVNVYAGWLAAQGALRENGKAIDDLTIAYKNASSTEDQAGKAADDLAAVVLANTAATRANTGARHREILEASAKARGINWKPGDAPSTSLQPRFQFLTSHRGSKNVAVSHALVEHFTDGSKNPLYINDKNLIATIKVLERTQRTEGPKSAKAIGKDITALKTELSRREAATAEAIREKNLSVTLAATFTNKVVISATEVAHASLITMIRRAGDERLFG